MDILRTHIFSIEQEETDILYSIAADFAAHIIARHNKCILGQLGIAGGDGDTVLRCLEMPAVESKATESNYYFALWK